MGVADGAAVLVSSSPQTNLLSMYSAHPSQLGSTAGHIPWVTTMFPEETTAVPDTLGACLRQYQATVLGPFAPFPTIFLQN